MPAGPFLFFYVLLLYAGFVLPIPGIILAWREWIKTRRISPARRWRRTMSQIGLFVCTTGLAFAISVAIAEGQGKLTQRSYYDSGIIYLGMSGSAVAIAVSALSEGQLRKYLLLCAVGLLCLFCFGLGEGI